MRNATQVRRFVDTRNDGRAPRSGVLREPFGSVRLRADRAGDRIVCRAEWGGWNWRAEGHDRATAEKRLSARLARLDPFEQTDADWGNPGHQIGPLDQAIPPRTRERMREHTQREARSAVGLLEAVFEAQARRPWAFPGERDEVPHGIEIEGYVTTGGGLALFPRTFYDIANAYFGRSAPHGAARGPAPSLPASGTAPRAEHHGLAGALRRLTEKGYMSSADGKLPHQIQSIEVYVFTPRP